MNYKHTLSTFLFYGLLSLCLLACLVFLVFSSSSPLENHPMACRWDIQYSGDHRSPCGGHLTSTAGTAETSFFAQMAKTLISKRNMEVLAFLLEILQDIPYLRSFVFGRLVFLLISVFSQKKVFFFYFYSQRFVGIQLYQLSTRKKFKKTDSVVRHLHPSLMRLIFVPLKVKISQLGGKN